MNLIKNKYIAIIGAGPGGMTLARLLQMKGAIVKIYERDVNQNSRPPGATLDLHEESGLLALKAAELIDDFNANYRPGADKMRIVDKNANILIDDHANPAKTESRPEIDRGPLLKILFESLDSDTVVWDRHLVRLHPKHNSWELEFDNGIREYADIVIGADGARSKVRQFLTPIQPAFAGIMVVEGEVHDADIKTPTIAKLLKGGKIFALGEGRNLIISSKGGGGLVFYLSWASEENWAKVEKVDPKNRIDVFSAFKKIYFDWASIWDELFIHAELPFALRPQYCMPFKQRWETQSNITLIGDAAHLMPPFAGEGVNMAMLDALELANNFTESEFSDEVTAIKNFESKMFSRLAVVGKDTIDQTHALHSTNGLQYMVEMFRV